MNRNRLCTSLAVALAITAIICLAQPGNAEITTYCVGDYIVSFDLGDAVSATAFAPRVSTSTSTSESSSGDLSVVYTLYESRGIYSVTIRIEELIGVITNETGKSDALYGVATDLSVDPLVVDMAFMTIDEHEALVSLFADREYVAVWSIDTHDSTAVVTIGSTYPWERGTKQFFETIHIEDTRTI